jgi:hypothetical protein
MQQRTKCLKRCFSGHACAKTVREKKPARAGVPVFVIGKNCVTA